jgi:integrase/recombinase XerD
MQGTLLPRSWEKYTSLPVLGSVVAEFAAWLSERGFSSSSVRRHLRATAVVDRDLRRAGVCDSSCVSRLALDECLRSNAGQPQILATVRALGRFLGEKGVVSEPQQICNYKDAILADYAKYLTEVRGLVAATVSCHLCTVTRFLAGLDEKAVAFRLSTLSSHDIETFVRAAGQHYERDTLAHVVAQFRSFLRFLGIRGLAPSGLDNQVDSPRTYRRDRPPRSLPWETVRALLQSIDQGSPVGLRDYAMLLLIATYGLRCCEIADLALNDLQWRDRRIRIPQRKTGSVVYLPLTDEVGTVLERYLRARPPSERREVFLRMRAPAGPLRSTAVSDAFSRWAKRSGLGIPYEGAHCLRHSYAVNLLRHGTPLKTIGDILGHRLAESTCMYLGLALEDLREVALPVPGVSVEDRGGCQP